MADILFLVVRYAHIISAILWIGGLGFSKMVLGSALSKVDMPARKETLKKLIPIANRFLPRVAASTIVWGAILYLLIGNYNPDNLVGTSWGLVILAALILSTALLVFGIFVVKRSSEAILVHLNEEACSHGPEVGKLQGTFSRGQLIATVWGFVILGLMVVAVAGL